MGRAEYVTAKSNTATLGVEWRSSFIYDRWLWTSLTYQESSIVLELGWETY